MPIKILCLHAQIVLQKDMQKDGFLLGFDTFQSTVDGFWVRLKGLAVDQIMVLMLSVLVYQDPLVLRDLFLDVSDV